MCVTSGGCTASWSPIWRSTDSTGEWWAEFTCEGGGALTKSLSVEVIGGPTTPLTYNWGRWAGGVTNITRGTMIILHATDALGATSQTVPFRYMQDTAPATDACRTTPRTNTTCQPLSRGLVTITIDDSGSTQPTIAVPILNKYAVKATFFHVPNFLTWLQTAKDLAAQGHETGSHTMTHTNLTSMSASQLDQELRDSKAWLETNIAPPVESFACPSGDYNAASIAAIKKYYQSHRTTNEGFNFVGTDTFELNTYFGMNTSTVAAMCDQIRDAAAKKAWLIYTFHDFTTASSSSMGFTVTSALFDGVLACAKNTPGIDVVTEREGVKAIQCGSPGVPVGGFTGGGAGGGGGSTGGGGGSTGGGGGSSGGGTGGGTGAGGGGGSTGGGGGATGGGSGDTAGFTVGPSGCAAEQLESAVSVGGYISDRYSWSDSTCARRSAALVRNNVSDPGGSNGGFMRELVYSVNGVQRTARGTGGNGYNGWGHVVMHYGTGADTTKAKRGTYRTVLSGQNHSIHEFKYAMNPGGPVTATVQWFFATGRSEPIYSITYDVTAKVDAINADTRSPYGDITFEGQMGQIAGIGWGDDYKFTTTGSGPVSPNSTWDYTQPNSVPYVRMWSSTVDAEMGSVQTVPMAARVGGGEYGEIDACQGHTNSNQLFACHADGARMPDIWLWPFQLNQYEYDVTASSHRLAWGSSYGAIGKSSVTAFGRTFSGWPQVKYGVYMVVGPRTTSSVFSRVTQVERIAATVVNGATWNPMYATWDRAYAPGGTTFNVDPRGGAITTPIFRFTSFTGSSVSEVRVGGVTQTAGVGYFATIDPATQTLWITLNGTVSGNVSVLVR